MKYSIAIPNIGRFDVEAISPTEAKRQFPLHDEKTLAVYPPPRLGDKIERAIGRVPGIKNLPCYENGKLKPESGCGKRKAWLNSLSSQAGPPQAKD